MWNAKTLVGKQYVGRGEYKQDPKHLGNEQMRQLQPDRGQQNHVHCAKSNLSHQCDGKNECPLRVILLSPKAPEQSQNIDGTHHCRNRVEEPQAQQRVTA